MHEWTTTERSANTWICLGLLLAALATGCAAPSQSAAQASASGSPAPVSAAPVTEALRPADPAPAASPPSDPMPASVFAAPTPAEPAPAASAPPASVVTLEPSVTPRPSASAKTTGLPPPSPRLTQAPAPSQAQDPRAYRRDAARHIYGAYRELIYKGRMPPLLYAIGVMQVDIDGGGRVENIRWMREPSHAPEVVSYIEAMVRAAAPYPVPARMGRVTYTDVWLWDKSSKFQLDTLTEGQR